MKIDVCRWTHDASSAAWYRPVAGLLSFSPCALLVKTAHKSVPRSDGERGGLVFFTCLFLEERPVPSNTRQDRKHLFVSRRSATVRLCRRKILLPSYQFGLDTMALVRKYSLSGAFQRSSSLKIRAVARNIRVFRKHGLFWMEGVFIPEWHSPRILRIRAMRPNINLKFRSSR